MSSNLLLQMPVDPAIKARAEAVMSRMGITLADAVGILLTRTANEGALPFTLASDAAGHDAWFRAKVEEALADERPAIPHEQVVAHFAERRNAARKRLQAQP